MTIVQFTTYPTLLDPSLLSLSLSKGKRIMIEYDNVAKNKTLVFEQFSGSQRSGPAAPHSNSFSHQLIGHRNYSARLLET